MVEPRSQDEDEAALRQGRRTRLSIHPRVLVIDDDADFLALFRELLEGEGYIVETATRGTAALMLAGAHPPDAIVCDLVMPGGDGFDVIDRLRATEETQDIPIFAITGVSELEGEETATAALHAGFAGLFHKPVNWPAFRDLLAGVLIERTQET